jgi:putative ABC transport system permease protein
MQVLANDLRHAGRRLKSAPAFTLVALITLALGVATTTAIYAVVDALMLRPLPYRDSHRLVEINVVDRSGFFIPVTTRDLDFWRAQSDIFDAVEAYAHRSAVLAGAGEPQTVIGAALSGGTMQMLGIQPQIGRALEARDSAAGAEQVIVLSDALWRSRFAASRDIVGQTVRLDEQSYTVVGVMPQGFSYPYGRRQFWVPLATGISEKPSSQRITIAARIRADLSPADGQLRTETRAGAFFETGTFESGSKVRLDVPTARHLNTPVRRALLVLSGAVLLLLLIACANVANLLLVQGAGRDREMAIRAALGASRGRLVRQLLSETFLLALAGGGLGLLLAQWTIDAIAAVAPREMTFLTVQPIRLDARVIGFEIALTLVAAAIFGILPAFRGARVAPRAGLSEGRGATGTPRQERLRRAFVLTQIALSLVLLVGAGLMARTFAHITHLDPGFDPRNLVAIDLQLPRWKYGTREVQSEFFQTLSARSRNLPGVTGTTLTGGVPPGGGGISFGLTFEIEGRGVVLDDPQLLLPFAEVDGDYFATLGIPLKAGRVFTSEDTLQSPRVVVLGETMAQTLWKGVNPIGDRLRLRPGGTWYTVVGVVGDVYQLRHEQTRGQFALYYANSQGRGMPAQQTLVVRTAGDPMPLINDLRTMIWSVDPDQPIARIETVVDAYAEFFAVPRFYTFLMTAFAFMGLTITSVGVYGVLAYAVAQRTREFGIRTALGAQRSQVMALALRSGVWLTATGIVTGVIASLALVRVMESLLVDIQPTDPLTFGATVVVLALASLAASWIPARHATRVDPVVALRHD